MNGQPGVQLLYARSRDLSDARRRLHKILYRCARADVLELTRLGRTLDACRDELLAYWTPTGRRGVSNGPTEAVNALSKKVKRVGHGFRNLTNYRLRLLLTVGPDWNTVPWQGAPATPIRPLTTERRPAPAPRRTGNRAARWRSPGTDRARRA